MKATMSLASLAIASLALLLSPVRGQASQTLNTDGQPTHLPGADLTMRTPSYKGCFSDPGDMIDMGPYTFQALGWCQPLCIRLQKPYLALVNGTNCLCGDNPPSGDNNNKVDDSNCQTTCTGFGDATCGGQNYFAVYNDGFLNGDTTGTVKINIPVQTDKPLAAAESASSSPTSAGGQVSTILVTQPGGQTIPTVTQVAATAQSTNETSPGPNKVAIAVGVVVGVIALAAIIGGLFFWMRHRKNQAIAEERARLEALTNRVTGEKPGSSYSLGDSRLDQNVMFQRRASDGSIADNEDYSRRILKVTNPED